MNRAVSAPPGADPAFIFFDLMGTLLRFEEDERAYLRAIAGEVAAQGLSEADVFLERYHDWRRRRAHLYPEHKELPLTARLRIGLSDAPERALDAVVAGYKQFYVARTRPMPGVPEMLEAWRGRARLGVVSNFFLAGFPEELCRIHGLIDYFDFVIDSAQVGWRKPHSAIYRAAMQRAGVVDAAAVLFVGDDPVADRYGPSLLGLRTMMYGDRYPGDAPSIGEWSAFRPRGCRLTPPPA